MFPVNFVLQLMANFKSYISAFLKTSMNIFCMCECKHLKVKVDELSGPFSYNNNYGV